MQHSCKLAFLAAILGISVLFSVLLFQKPIEITEKNNLSLLMQNTLVSVKGTVSKQTPAQDYCFIQLNNSISFKFYSRENLSLLNKKIKITGRINQYQNYTYIKALKIEE